MTPDRFGLLLRFDPAGGLDPTAEALFADRYFSLQAENMHPMPRLLHSGERLVVLCGDPIASDRRNDETVLVALADAPEPEDFARALNGSFLILIYDSQAPRLTVITDRFASLALFYGLSSGILCASLSFKQLLDLRRAEDVGRIDSESVFQFLALRRLLGEETFDPGVRYLASAAVLRWDGTTAAPSLSRYWQPDYAAQPPEGTDLVEALAEGLQRAMALATSDERRFALFLSGGLDSRALLAAAREPLPCVTTSLQRNNEVEVAEAVALARGAPFHFLPRPADVHDNRLDDAVFLTGGMQVYSETQFLGYGPPTAALGDCILLGLGLDIFFGGLYLPKTAVKLFGRPALHHRLLRLGRDLAEDYIGGVKYRLRTSDPLRIVREDRRARVTGGAARCRRVHPGAWSRARCRRLRSLGVHAPPQPLAALLLPDDELGPDLGRVPQPGAGERSLRPRHCHDCGTETGRHALPGRHRQAQSGGDGRAQRQHQPAGRDEPAPTDPRGRLLRWPSSACSVAAIPRVPGWQDRSWPSPKTALEGQPRLLAAARALPRSEALASLELFDTKALAEMLGEHESGGHDHAILINLLLTIERTLAT